MSLNISNNNPLFLSEETLNGASRLFFLYLIQGIVSTPLSLIFFIAIWKVPSLREKKEYIIISAVAFIDFISSAGFLTAGIGRILLIVNGEANRLVTKLDCLLTPWNAFFIFSEHMSGMTMAMASLDRLLLVWNPLRYIGFGRSYAYGMLAATHFPYVAMIVRLTISLALSELEKNKPSICFTEWVYDTPAYFHFVYTQSMMLSFASVVLYLAVLYKYRKSQVNILPTLVEASVKIEVKKQRRLTITLGFGCLFTFVFVIFPLVVKNIFAVLYPSNDSMAIFVPILAVCRSANPIASFVLYIHRHKDLRTAVRCLLKCKKVTLGMLQTTTAPPVAPLQRRVTHAQRQIVNPGQREPGLVAIESV